MRKILLIAVALLSLSAALFGCRQSSAGKPQPAGGSGERVEVTFDFRRGGIASSQYAIWIEDTQGRVVRTLYATSFTVKGGYEYREDAIPLWVGKANPAAMSSAQVDALTGATPHDGPLRYQWDGTSDSGTPVAPGKYRLMVEATLYWKSRVLYSGDFTWGGAQASIPMKARRFSPSDTNSDMITGLKASHLK